MKLPIRLAFILGGCLPLLTLAFWSFHRSGGLAAPPAADGIRLTEVTEASGIDFTYQNGGNGQHYYLETMGGGAAFLDADGDGWEDILLTQGAPLPAFEKSASAGCVLYHNNHDGTFTDITAGSGLDAPMYALGIAVGDYDNDGKPDIYVTALGGNHLFHNEGGKFRDVTKTAGVAGKDMSTSAAWLDYDDDGHIDLFVCRYMDYDLRTNPHCKDFRGRSTYCSPNVYPGTQCLLYHNNGDGTFSDVSKKSGIARATGRSLGVVCADLNGDGRVDIFVSNDLAPNYLFLNNGDGSFTDYGAVSGVAYGEAGVARAGMGVDVADYRNEGRFSLAVTNFENEPTALYHNGGNGLFTEDSFPSGVGSATLDYLKWGCRFVDLDLDGWQDLFLVNGHVDDHADDHGKRFGYAQPCQVLRNEGAGLFKDISPQSGAFFTHKQVGRGLAMGDFNNDGKPDLLVACNRGRAILLRNDTRTANQWFRLSLIGMGCNRDALGAVVSVTAGALKQTQTVHSGGSYLSDHDRRLLFGIGRAHNAHVEIRWPCGGLQALDVEAGSSVVVREQGCKIAQRKVLR